MRLLFVVGFFLSLQLIGGLFLNCRCRYLQCKPDPQLFRGGIKVPVCEISCSIGLWERIRVGVSWRFWRGIKIGLNLELESKAAPEASGYFYWLWTRISLDVDCKMGTLNELKLKPCTRPRSLCKGCLTLISSLLVEVTWYTFLACVRPVMRLFYDCTCQLYPTCHLFIYQVHRS